MTATAGTAVPQSESWQFMQDADAALQTLAYCLADVRTALAAGGNVERIGRLAQQTTGELQRLQRDMELIKHATAVDLYHATRKAVR